VTMHAVVAGQPQELRYPALKSGWRAELRDFHDFLEVVCQTATPLPEPPSLHVALSQPQTEARQIEEYPLTTRGKQLFSATYPLPRDHNGEVTLKLTATPQKGTPLEQAWVVPIQNIVPKTGGTVSAGDAASVTIPADALYEPIFARLAPITEYAITEGLPVLSDVYALYPAGEPFEKRAVVRLRYPDEVTDLRKIGIFTWDALKKCWVFLDDQEEPKTRKMTAEIYYAGVYALLADNLKPVIAELTPERGSTVVGTLKQLAAILRDEGKGIDENMIVMRLDGQAVAGEFDPDRSQYTYHLTEKLAPGKHILMVQAADLAGNQAQTRTATFIVRAE
jgi:hypothetical protein